MRSSGQNISYPVFMKYSYGIIAETTVDGQKYRLMIQRRYTYAYEIFLRGKYDLGKLQELWSGMSRSERFKISESVRDTEGGAFERLWNIMWVLSYNSDNFNDSFLNAQRRWSTVLPFLRELISRCDSSTDVEPEWVYPRGRKNYKEESDIKCAIREFREETGISAQITFTGEQSTEKIIDEDVEYVVNYFHAVFPSSIIAETYASPYKVSQRIELSRLCWKKY
jgi:NUDIX domain